MNEFDVVVIGGGPGWLCCWDPCGAIGIKRGFG